MQVLNQLLTHALEEDSSNWLLSHSIATNVDGQIGSAVAGGVILTYASVVLRMLGLIP